jgi:hypothetical protein
LKLSPNISILVRMHMRLPCKTHYAYESKFGCGIFLRYILSIMILCENF